MYSPIAHKTYALGPILAKVTNLSHSVLLSSFLALPDILYDRLVFLGMVIFLHLGTVLLILFSLKDLKVCPYLIPCNVGISSV